MDKEKVRALIERVRKEILDSTNSLIDLDSAEAQEASENYMAYYNNAMVVYDGYINTPPEFSKNVVEVPAPVTLKAYKLKRLYDDAKTPLGKASDLLESMCVDPETGNHNFEWQQKSFHEFGERLEQLFTIAKSIHDSIVEGDYASAQKKAAYVGETDTSPFFMEAKELFLVAGKNGKLSDLKSGKREPWDDSTYKMHSRHLSVSEFFWKDLKLSAIKARDLDYLFKEIISNLPLSNKKPYNTMSWEQRINSVLNGEVEELDSKGDSLLISKKAVREYLKTFQSFYRFLFDSYLYEKSPLPDMRYTVRGDKNRRGAFSREQVKSIAEYCMRQGGDKKWPVLIMCVTGMRNQEVMQLTKDDIKLEQGIWYIDVHGRNGSVKTEASVRKVPLPNLLIKHSFVEYVQTKTMFLFDANSKFLTRYYANEIKRACHLPDYNDKEEPLSLYSLRHFVITELQILNVNRHITQALVGHHQGITTLTDSQYSHEVPLNELKLNIEKVKIDI